MIYQEVITIPELSGPMARKLYVYIPESYETNERKYPVMYMFDGHNVFFDRDATFGKSWGMKEYLEKNNKQIIVVAVAANPEGDYRLEEYSPVDFSYSSVGKIAGRGVAYMNWMVNTLKPYIDQKYRTLDNRENTIVCGSSMGGLMSIYAVSAYNHIFGKAVSLSPSFWVNPGDFMSLIDQYHFHQNTKIYMSYGSEEMSNHPENPTVLKDVVKLLQTKSAGIKYEIIPGGAHCEASWEKQIPCFMVFLNL